MEKEGIDITWDIIYTEPKRHDGCANILALAWRIIINKRVQDI